MLWAGARQVFNWSQQFKRQNEKLSKEYNPISTGRKFLTSSLFSMIMAELSQMDQELQFPQASHGNVSNFKS